MSASVRGGKPIKAECSSNVEGHRVYDVKWQVATTDRYDGPFMVLNAAGLPLVGTPWSGYLNDIDLYAYCSPEMKATLIGDISLSGVEGGGCLWHVDQKFTTLPFKRCADFSYGDPLMEPPQISGSFTRYTKPAEKDRFGKAILTSGHEPVRGIQKLFNSPSIIIEVNEITLGLNIFSQVINGVNDRPMWGVGSRCVMLSSVSWARKVYGVCGFYYTKRFEFEVKYETHDEKDILDCGYKVRKGSWVADVWTPKAGGSLTDPNNFMVYHDVRGVNFPVKTPLKNGDPLTDPTDPQYLPTVQLAPEFNFFALGVPAYIG